ncbi:hypothetical protein [Methylorubrum sp. POS3]|uniref:hypothetical protein n=1 Tax=Methylorubrum sp. POS3 TaxID=2998492 RepID=UPI00372AF904
MRRAAHLLLALLAFGPATARAAPGGVPPGGIDNWSDLRNLFVRCWTVPKGTEGSLIAFQFLLAPDGGMRGPPRVVGKRLTGDADAQKRFSDAAYAPFSRCLPAPLTPGFKALLGETLIHLSYVNGPRIKARNLGAAMTIFAEEARREAE